MGEENAISLISELLEQEGVLGTRLFADALALVKFDHLPEKVKEWLEKEGLVLLEGENIRVNLRHQNETRARTCHEVGQFIQDGAPGFLDLRKTTRQISLKAFTSHEVSEKFPRGALAEINIWDKEHPILQYTVAGAYVAGTGPNARGIIVPARQTKEPHWPVVYMHTGGSFEKGRDQRNFYIRQGWGDVDEQAVWAFETLGMYLKNEVSEVAGDPYGRI